MAEKPTREAPGPILIVDDEPGVLQLVAAILTGEGYEVLTAASGMEALSRARGREREIMLLLTDVVMPDLNGPHVADNLLKVNPSLRVLFMSGWEPQVIEHHGALRRGFRTLFKPFSADELLSAIEQTLALRAG